MRNGQRLLHSLHAPAPQYYDDFSTNPSGRYTPISAGGDNVDPNRWDSVNKWYDAYGGLKSPSVYRADWGGFPDTTKVTLRCSMEDAQNRNSIVTVGFADLAGRTVGVQPQWNGDLVWNEYANSGTLVAGVVPRHVWMLLEFTRAGNNAHVKVTREDTSAILYDADHAIWNTSTLGAGKTLYPYWYVSGFNAGGFVDDFTVIPA